MLPMATMLLMETKRRMLEVSAAGHELSTKFTFR
jgi:hypothetical protein